tara:strand:+ start:70 stop:354 length:285 start_codon:yes stop_codon:yes gene_type:complete
MANKITFKIKKNLPKFKRRFPIGMTKNNKFIFRKNLTRTKHDEPFLAKAYIKPTVSKSVGVNSSRFTGTKSIFDGGKKKTKRRRKKKSNTRKKK